MHWEELLKAETCGSFQEHRWKRNAVSALWKTVCYPYSDKIVTKLQQVIDFSVKQIVTAKSGVGRGRGATESRKRGRICQFGTPELVIRLPEVGAKTSCQSAGANATRHQRCRQESAHFYSVPSLFFFFFVLIISYPPLSLARAQKIVDSVFLLCEENKEIYLFSITSVVPSCSSISNRAANVSEFRCLRVSGWIDFVLAPFTFTKKITFNTTVNEKQ